MDANRLKVTVSRLHESLIEEMEEEITEAAEEHDIAAIQTLRLLIVGYGAAWDHIDQQQAEIERLREDKRRLFEVYDAQYARSCEYAGQIERLNRAYEYLCNELSWLGKDSVIVAAQRIKEGKGGEQG